MHGKRGSRHTPPVVESVAPLIVGLDRHPAELANEG